MMREDELATLRKELAVATTNHVSAVEALQVALSATTSPVTPEMLQAWKDARVRQQRTEALYHGVLNKLKHALGD
jgi:hypothetical protein